MKLEMFSKDTYHVHLIGKWPKMYSEVRLISRGTDTAIKFNKYEKNKWGKFEIEVIFIYYVSAFVSGLAAAC